MGKVETPSVENIFSTVERIKSGSATSTELVKAHIERAKELNPELNAFITILEEDALTRAAEIDESIKNKDLSLNDKKLLGIPFTVKDLYLVEGTRTTSGSRFMEDFIAPYTSTVVQKCLDEGAILIGKCNCDPWGFGGSGENSGYGPARNPYDLERTPGGSSSGSAASLAAGIGYFSLGTDTGGSVRLPASFTNLYGLKPTYGRNSRYGIEAMGSSFDTPAFFARHIEDIEMLQEIMQGKDENDGTTFDLPLPSPGLERKDVSPGEVLVGLPKEFFVEGLDPEIKSAIDNYVAGLKEKGFKVKEVSIPSTEYGLAVYYILVPSELSSNRARYDGVRFGKKVAENYEDNLFESRSQFFEPEVKRRIMIGTYSLSAGYGDQFYKKASLVRAKLKHEFDKVFEEVDFLIAPVSPTPAFKLGEKSDDPVAMYLVDIFTVTANIVGIPSLAVPLGFNKAGLPIGMQVMGRKFEEKRIFEFVKKSE